MAEEAMDAPLFLLLSVATDRITIARQIRCFLLLSPERVNGSGANKRETT